MLRNLRRFLYGFLTITLFAAGCTLPVPLSRPENALLQEPAAVSQVSPTPTITPAPTATTTPLPQVRVEQAAQSLFLGDYDQALNEQQSAFSSASEPDVKASALLGIARTYLESGEISQAIRTTEQLLEQYPDSPAAQDAYFFLGKAYDASFQYQKAADAYAQYVKLRPAPLGSFVLEMQGDALYNADNYADAITAYQAAIDSNPSGDIINLQTRIGRSFSALGDDASAIRTFLQIYDSSNNEFTRAQVNFLAGQSYLNIGETEQAYARFLDSVNNYPRAYDSYSGLVALVDAGVPVDLLKRGLVDYYAGQYGIAIDVFNQYILSDTNHEGSAHYYKGQAALAIDEPAQAVSEWQALIRDHPQDPFWLDAWQEIAYVQWAYIENYDAAIQTLMDFVARYPESAEAPEMLFQAAQIMERDGQLTAAAQTWTRLLEEYPAAEKAYRGLFLAGITHFRLTNYSQALITFQRVLMLSSLPEEQSTAYFWIGKAKAAAQDNDGAKEAWTQAASLDPTGYYSERASELLEGKAPFTPGTFKDIKIDWELERTKAASWLRVAFSIPTETDVNGLDALAGDLSVQRAFAFHNLGLYQQARDEFEDMRTRFKDDPANLFRLLKPMVDLGYYSSAILTSRQILDLANLDDAGTLTAPPYFNYIRFGTYYKDLVLASADRDDLDPYFVWSLIRQESMFEGYVQSSAGAYGLMQIMPATGEEIASRLNWPPNYQESDLFRPYINLRMGVDYLATQRNYFDNHMYVAMAAYNAGPGNAMYWQELANGDPDLFLEVIRFEETRRYIRQIYEFWNIYRQVYQPEATTGSVGP